MLTQMRCARGMTARGSVWRAAVLLALVAAPGCSPSIADGERAAALTTTTTTNNTSNNTTNNTTTTTTTSSAPVDPAATASATTAPIETTAPTETSAVTSSPPPPTPTTPTSTTGPTATTTTATITGTGTATTTAIVDTTVVHSMLAGLRVDAEPPRVGYARELFPQWRDTNGSGCDARQDALAAQVIGFAQVDVFDRCMIVEGDWWSLFDGVAHAGSPSELDVDHVVALSEAWDSGASAWSLETRTTFANDPVNLLVVTASSNRSKGDRDVGEWRPVRVDAWCITATVTIATKHRYELSVDEHERDALAEMVATCGDSSQRTVDGVPVPGTAAFEALPAVTIVTAAPPRPAEPTPQPSSGACTSEQVDINTADVDKLQRITHIGPARAVDVIALRPYSSVEQLTRVTGIAASRIADIIREGIACV